MLSIGKAGAPTTACTGAQKAGGIGNSGFTIKRTSHIVRIPFVPCDAHVGPQKR
jgi:hypothetical protein